MKKLVILSDSHGNINAIESLARLFMENDYVVHLGDGANDIRSFRKEYPEKVYQCAGNCDFISPLPEEDILEIEGVRIFYCHGHKYGVKSDLTALAEKAKACDCDIALYGHTHRALISNENGVMLINPGTMSRPLGQGGSYCYLVIHNKKATPVIVGETYI